MLRITQLSALLLLFWASSNAQTTAEKEAIKQFCGCFEVKFEYAETFPRTENYQLAKPYEAEAIEYLVVDEETLTKLVLQNILVINDTFLIKHWRQDWEFQPKQIFDFQGNKTWDVNTLSASQGKGQWSQEVYEVDESPRYAGLSTWNFQDGKTIWENTTNAPLPRREYSHREDYQILRRHNRLMVKPDGWVHEQDNQKVALNGDKETILVEEKGWNNYRRIDDKKCAAAAKFWQEQRWYWKQVRIVWDSFLSTPGAFTLEKMVGADILMDELNGLSTQKFVNEQEAQMTIAKVLDKYRKHIEKNNP